MDIKDIKLTPEERIEALKGHNGFRASQGLLDEAPRQWVEFIADKATLKALRFVVEGFNKAYDDAPTGRRIQYQVKFMAEIENLIKELEGNNHENI